MFNSRVLALLALVFSCPAIVRAQITKIEQVGDKMVVCSHSGLTSSFNDCGVRADWYTHVFVGVISAVNFPVAVWSHCMGNLRFLGAGNLRFLPPLR